MPTFYDINQSSERGNLGVYPYKYDLIASDYYIYEPSLILNSSDLDFVIEYSDTTPLDLFLANGVPNIESTEDIENIKDAFANVFDSSDNVNIYVGNDNNKFYTCENVSLKLNQENSEIATNISTGAFVPTLKSVLEARSTLSYSDKAYLDISNVLDSIITALKEQSVSSLATSYIANDASNDLVDYWKYSHKNWNTNQFLHKGDSLVMLYDVNLNFKTQDSSYTALEDVDYSTTVFFAIRYYLNNYTLDDTHYNDVLTIKNIPRETAPIEAIQITDNIFLGPVTENNIQTYDIGSNLLEINNLNTEEINIGGGVSATDTSFTGEYLGSGEYNVNSLQIDELRIS